MKVRDSDQEGITENIGEMNINEMCILRKELEDKIVYHNGKINHCNSNLDQLKIINKMK